MLLLLLGCGDAYRDPMIESLGGEFPGTKPSEFHRPGQPCVLCHDSYEGAEPEMSVAGTLFRYPIDLIDGKQQAGFPVVKTGFEVRVVDSRGETRQKPVNCFGNFFFTKEELEPAYPLLTEVLIVDEAGTTTNVSMNSRIGRDGSCATCHRTPASFQAPGDGATWVQPDPNNDKSWLTPGPVVVEGGDDADFPPPAPDNCPLAFQ